MHVKKGDLVQVVAGDDKGKVGEVLEVRTKLASPTCCYPCTWLCCSLMIHAVLSHSLTLHDNDPTLAHLFDPQIYSKTGMVTIKDINMVTKHVKPQRDGEAGKIAKAEGPIHHSKVMHYSKEKGVRSRVSSK